MKLLMIAMVAMGLSGFSAGAARAADGFGLATVHALVSARYPLVAHIGADRLNTLLDADPSATDLVVLDAREPDEFAVSHVPGAVRVDPNSEVFMDVADQVRGKTVIIYCSVGWRSSRLAHVLAKSDAGAAAIYNLKGGVFDWHNRTLRLVNAQGETEWIHPYSPRWGKLIARQDRVRLHP